MLNCSIAWGEVAEVKPGFARVYFPSDELVSDWLPIASMRAMGDNVTWMPEKGEQVCCLMNATNDDTWDTGVIIGCTHNDEDEPDEDAAPGIFRMKFSDGGFIEYNKNTHKYQVTVGEDGEIVFNGGANGGVPMVGPLVDKINALEGDLNDLKGRYNTLMTVASGLATALAIPATAAAPILGGTLQPYFATLATNFTPYAGAVITPTVQPDLENVKVKH